MTYTEFWRQLSAVYPDGEAQAIARLVYEVRTGETYEDMLLQDRYNGKYEDLEDVLQRLLAGEPVQYALGEAPFGEYMFMVDRSVLIPRSETQWLTDIIVRSLGLIPHECDILDIGTGSGCIATTIALEAPTATNVTGWDISEEALAIARKNARRLEAEVTFEQQDMLNPPEDTCRWDIIVSNPPYVCEREKALMERHVLDWEPATALFVPDDDPLLFYRAIGRYAIKALREAGTLYLEINPLYASELGDLLLDTGFAQVRIYPDDCDKDRYIIAWR